MKIFFAFLLILFSLSPFSQEITYEESKEETSKSGIVIGRAIFSPQLEFIYENRDNIYLLRENEISDEVYVLRPKILLEIPREESYLKFMWVPQYRDFKDTEVEKNWTHFFEAEAKLKTSGGLELFLGDKFIKDAYLETREVDEGEELAFGLLPFDKNSLYFDLKYFFDLTNGFGINAGYDQIEFSKTEIPWQRVWYDYEKSNFGISYQRYMNPLLRMAVGLNYINFEPEDLVNFREYEGLDYYLQFYGDLSPTVNANLKLGYEDLDFKEAEDYKGFTAKGEIIWNFSNNRNLAFMVYRKSLPSNFGEAGSYVHNGIDINYNFKITEKFFGKIGAEFAKNDYNDISRVDDWWIGKINFGYHFNPLISLRLNYLYQDRNSNVDCIMGCEYKQNIILLNLVIGY